MAVLKFKNGSSWEEIKIPEPVSLAGMCYITFNSYGSPASSYGGTWSQVNFSNNNSILGSYDSGTRGNMVLSGSTSSSGTTLLQVIKPIIWLRTA